MILLFGPPCYAAEHRVRLPPQQEMVEDTRGTNLFFTTDLEKAIRAADMIFVSVSTPLKDAGIGAGYAPDLVNWEKIARMIARVCLRFDSSAWLASVAVETVPLTLGLLQSLPLPIY